MLAGAIDSRIRGLWRLSAVGAGVSWAIPWLGALAGHLGGDLEPRPLAWHEAHAVAGALFTLTLGGLAVLYIGRLGVAARAALGTAVFGAFVFFVANAGEALTGSEAFVPLYGVGLLVLSGGALVLAALARSALAPPLPFLIALLGSFPLALPLGFVPVIGSAALVVYGASWIALGLRG